MRQHNAILALAMGICLFEVTPTLAATSSTNSDANLASEIEKITAQQAELQQEVTTLKSELRQVRQQKIQAQQQLAAQRGNTTATGTNVPVERVVSAKDSGQTQAAENLIGRPVITSPYLNLTSAYDASDLIIYESPINQDLTLLEQRKTLQKELGGESELPSFSRPLVTISGKLEAQSVYQSPFSGQDQSNFDLSGAELDVLGEVSPWAMGYMSIQYNNAPLDQNLTGSGNPISNSNLFLNRGFVTIGNLAASPIYLTAGQMYVPFGSYSSYMLSNPVTKSLGRINTRAAELGLAKDGVYTSLFAFNGASTVNNSTVIDNFGGNLGYKFSNLGHNGDISGDFAVAIINNTTDAQGVQNTGGSSFEGFSQSSATENLQRLVPGIDVRGYLSNTKFYGLAEAVLTTRAYAPQDMSFNGEGAQPMAGHAEVGYITKILQKPTVFTLGFDATSQALAMGLPNHSYIATVNTSIWKNTIEALEFRHDVNYSNGDTAGGLCDNPDVSGAVMFCPVTVAGSTQNSVIAQLGVYF